MPIQAKRLASVATPATPSPASNPGGGQPLPADVGAAMSRSLGADLSRVRIHEDSSAERAGAAAYTRGADIFFAPGRYDPASQPGRELLGHELTHVIQQGAGRVGPGAEGSRVNADASLEAEADLLGARAARGLPAGSRGTAAGRAPEAALQCRKKLSDVVAGKVAAQQMHSPTWGVWYRIAASNPNVHVSVHPIPAQKVGYPDLIPAFGDILFDELHITIHGIQFYFSDDGTVPNAPGVAGRQPAWNNENWPAAIAEAAKFLCIDPRDIAPSYNAKPGAIAQPVRSEIVPAPRSATITVMITIQATMTRPPRPRTASARWRTA